jgi:adenosyl cobinamide kinase/adenosyl cobinamide phosphate guanylyltransferase
MTELTQFETTVKERLEAIHIPIRKCRDCEKEIFFITTKSGKGLPITMDLKVHFEDCPGAQNFRKSR